MAVGQLNGTGKVSGDSKSRTLTVEYEPSEVTVESMQEALLNIGYESTFVP
jgi:hypothetical protein